jgi:hypothetical protein
VNICLYLQGDTDVDNCLFTGTGTTAISDFTGPGNLNIRQSRFMDNKQPVSLSTSGWTFNIDGCRFDARAAANLVTATTPTAQRLANCWTSDGVYFGRSPTTAIPAASLAGPGTVWYDTTVGYLKLSDGTNWQRLMWGGNNLSDISSASSAIGNLISGASINESNLVLPAGSAASPVNGEIHYGSVSQCLVGQLGGITNRFVGCLYTQSSAVTVTATGETSFTSGATSTGTLTLPANFFVAGKTLHIYARGYYTTAVSSPGAQRISLKFGSTTVLQDANVNLTANITSARVWEFEGEVICQSTGTNGTVIGQGTEKRFTAHTTAQSIDMLNTSAVTINTTIQQVLTFVSNMDTTGNSFTITNLRFVVLN